MTNLEEWIKRVEIDVPEEAQSLHATISTLSENGPFSVEEEIEDDKTIHVIEKKGFNQKLQIKSELAKETMLKIITEKYLPRQFR